MRVLLVAVLTYKEVTMLEKRETTTAFHGKGKEGYHDHTHQRYGNGSLTTESNMLGNIILTCVTFVYAAFV